MFLSVLDLSWYQKSLRLALKKDYLKLKGIQDVQNDVLVQERKNLSTHTHTHTQLFCDRYIGAEPLRRAGRHVGADPVELAGRRRTRQQRRRRPAGRFRFRRTGRDGRIPTGTPPPTPWLWPYRLFQNQVTHLWNVPDAHLQLLQGAGGQLPQVRRRGRRWRPASLLFAEQVSSVSGHSRFWDPVFVSIQLFWYCNFQWIQTR